MIKHCIKYNSCPIFKGVNRINKEDIEEYEQIYCKSDKWCECKRYLVYKKVGYCPADILPDSALSIHKIIKLSRELVY